MNLNADRHSIEAGTVQRSGYAGIDQGGEDRLVYGGQFVPQAVDMHLVPRHTSDFSALPPMPQDRVIQGDRETMN